MATTVVVSGALANKPGNGGEAWNVLSWVRGLRLLGVDAWLVEELAGPASIAATSWFTDVTGGFGLGDRAVLLTGEGPLGAIDSLDDVRDVLGAADLLLNISGTLRSSGLVALARRRAYVDLDPGFTQIWHERGVADLGLDRHDVHLSVGTNIGSPMCPIPTGGLQWLPCRQPVILDDWPVTPLPPDGAFSTVSTWRNGYGTVEWEGVEYGLKVHEFRRIIDIATRVGVPLEVALSIHAEDEPDATRLRSAGWRVASASDVAATPAQFRAYVQASRGELSVAQGVYAHARTGWFSDRTVRYLASGRPAVVQDTGMGEHLPTGSGLLTFRDADSAVAAIDAVEADPVAHAVGARAFVEDHFEARAVLADVLGRCEVSW